MSTRVRIISNATKAQRWELIHRDYLKLEIESRFNYKKDHSIDSPSKLDRCEMLKRYRISQADFLKLSAKVKLIMDIF